TELLETVKTPMYSPDGSLIGVLGLGRNITERRQTEEELRRAQKMEAIGQLTGGIAHDFNNLLGIILGNLELLERQIPKNHASLKRLEGIKKSTHRAAKLTKQLLSFSRLQAAHLSITDINQVIEGMESLIIRSVTPEVEVEYNFDHFLWLTEIDPGDFEDSLLNLIINARDAMPNGGHLTIETRNTTLDNIYCAQHPGIAPGEYVELSISDSGEGIAAEDQAKIFDPFYTTKPQGKGTGLGLSMVFGFINRSKGHIKVYSEGGRGTTFRLYLPRSEGDEIGDIKESEDRDSLPTGDETILVVDDEPGLLEIARESLEAMGYQTLAAHNGLQALELLAAHPDIDLIFSDVVMPGGINGYELAEQALENRPELKVLLTSGYTGKALAYNGQARFNASLLSKPYSQSELAKRIREILDV
ncbi:MAG: ATP-binding protein, partial [Gammaproteobacteria bacterium]|nr:ATP-binding protein [Gammaproteobacteria bacterium]